MTDLIARTAETIGVSEEDIRSYFTIVGRTEPEVRGKQSRPKAPNPDISALGARIYGSLQQKKGYNSLRDEATRVMLQDFEKTTEEDESGTRSEGSETSKTAVASNDGKDDTEASGQHGTRHQDRSPDNGDSKNDKGKGKENFGAAKGVDNSDQGVAGEGRKEADKIASANNKDWPTLQSHGTSSPAPAATQKSSPGAKKFSEVAGGDPNKGGNPVTFSVCFMIWIGFFTFR